MTPEAVTCGSGRYRAPGHRNAAVVRAEYGTPFEEVVRLPAGHRISGLPVVDEDEQVIGVISETDLMTRQARCVMTGRLTGGHRQADGPAALPAADHGVAGQGGIPRPRRAAGAGGATAATSRSSAREPRPTRVGIPLF
ncbi:hypothetical protein GCM10027162_52690 [Streptomyces incanus]